VRVFLIAGEPSGDNLGAALMAGLKALVPGAVFDGIGGPRMEAEGLRSRFPMDELSVMGIAEVLPRYRHLMRRIRETAAAVVEMQPDVLVTIDSPDFVFRVAKRVKAESPVRIVHYVAPSVWAWRPGRARKVARLVDQLLTLLPFEPPYFEAEGLRADFVGHPVVAEPVATAAEAAGFRARHGIGEAPLLMVLPGSRRGEVARLARPFGETVRVGPRRAARGAGRGARCGAGRGDGARGGGRLAGGARGDRAGGGPRRGGEAGGVPGGGRGARGLGDGLARARGIGDADGDRLRHGLALAPDHRADAAWWIR
jgi:hypothetical protein